MLIMEMDVVKFASLGDTKSVQRILFGDSGQECLSPALFAAIEGDHIAVVQILLRAGASVHDQNMHGENALHVACRYGRVHIVKEILYGLEANFKCCNMQNTNGETALMVAIRRRKVDCCMEILKEASLDLNAVNLLRQTALHLAVLNGLLSVTRMLLSQGITVDRRDHVSYMNGETALFYTIRKYDVEQVALLVDSGACALKMNNQGETPMTIACKTGFQKIIVLLLKHFECFVMETCESCDHRKKQMVVLDTLEIAVREDKASIFKCLLKECCIDIIEETLPHWIFSAAKHGSVSVMAVLLQTSPLDMFSQPYSVPHTSLSKRTLGECCLLYAVYNGNVNVLKKLVKHGCDPTFKCQQGGISWGLLYTSVLNGDLYTTECLLHLGCDTNTTDICGNDPLMVVLLQNMRSPMEPMLMRSPQMDSIFKPCINGGFDEESVFRPNNMFSLTKILVESGCQVNRINHSGYTPLLCAAQQTLPWLSYKLCHLLMENGALLKKELPAPNNNPEPHRLNELSYSQEGANIDLFILILNHDTSLFESILETVNVNLFHLVQKKIAVDNKLVYILHMLLHTNVIHVIFPTWQSFISGPVFDRYLNSQSTTVSPMLFASLKTDSMKLSNLCRRVIRVCLRRRIEQKVRTLDLPASLKDYLILQEFREHFHYEQCI